MLCQSFRKAAGEVKLVNFSDEDALELADRKAHRQVLTHRSLWDGHIIELAEDLVRVSTHGEPALRQYTLHPGAVAVVVMRGEKGAEEILLERQYRHPVGAELWEIPAGLLDVAGEEPHIAAARELEEEADLRAEKWDVLLDYFTSPGGSSESVRIFLAQNPVPTGKTFERFEEEADLVFAWVDLDEAVSRVLSGRIHNPNAVSGILATYCARERNWADLRPLDAEWMR